MQDQMKTLRSISLMHALTISQEQLKCSWMIKEKRLDQVREIDQDLLAGVRENISSH